MCVCMCIKVLSILHSELNLVFKGGSGVKFDKNNQADL